MMLSPGLLASLKRSRLIVRRARATTGIGERRSRRKGSGMEFVDYRKYQPGDDVRHLDPHLYLRTGGHYVREHVVEQQLPVSIIIDGSASMKFGTPSKFDFSRGLAAALAFVGLAGGDVVEVGMHASGRLSWSPRIRGVRRLPVLFDWLAAQRPGGRGFGKVLGEALPRLAYRGLAIVISDWWVDDPDADLQVLASLRQEVFAVHVVSAEELDPARLGIGEACLVDSETAHEIELMIDRDVLDGYRRAFEYWQDRLRARIAAGLGRYLPVRSDANLERLLIHDWRQLGLLA
jgi:uncharacterized protein (DUF58 family)